MTTAIDIIEKLLAENTELRCEVDRLKAEAEKLKALQPNPAVPPATLEDDMGSIVHEIMKHEICSTRQLYAALRPMRHQRVDDALATLKAEGVVTGGNGRPFVVNRKGGL